jgi:hypothetical protein
MTSTRATASRYALARQEAVAYPLAMPREAKAKGGRVTPKATGRYTPPLPRSLRVSPRWVPVTMFFFLITGMLMLIVNYFGVLPGGTSNWYLVGGLVLVTAGFIVATKYH